MLIRNIAWTALLVLLALGLTLTFRGLSDGSMTSEWPPSGLSKADVIRTEKTVLGEQPGNELVPLTPTPAHMMATPPPITPIVWPTPVTLSSGNIGEVPEIPAEAHRDLVGIGGPQKVHQLLAWPDRIVVLGSRLTQPKIIEMTLSYLAKTELATTKAGTPEGSWVLSQQKHVRYPLIEGNPPSFTQLVGQQVVDSYDKTSYVLLAGLVGDPAVHEIAVTYFVGDTHLVPVRYGSYLSLVREGAGIRFLKALDREGNVLHQRENVRLPAPSSPRTPAPAEPPFMTPPDATPTPMMPLVWSTPVTAEDVTRLPEMLLEAVTLYGAGAPVEMHAALPFPDQMLVLATYQTSGETSDRQLNLLTLEHHETANPPWNVTRESKISSTTGGQVRPLAYLTGREILVGGRIYYPVGGLVANPDVQNVVLTFAGGEQFFIPVKHGVFFTIVPFYSGSWTISALNQEGETWHTEYNVPPFPTPSSMDAREGTVSPTPPPSITAPSSDSLESTATPTPTPPPSITSHRATPAPIHRGRAAVAVRVILKDDLFHALDSPQM